MKRKLLIGAMLLLLLGTAGALAQEESFLSCAENAILIEYEGEYPKTVYREEASHSVETLLSKLLGEDYVTEERGKWDSCTRFVEAGTEEPWTGKSVRMYDDGSLWYYDPYVSGERGGEYEPPQMNMMPDESLLLLKGLLQPYFTQGELDFVSRERQIADRWSWSDRWMTEAEYREYVYNCDLHYFTFEHRSKEGLPILGDSIAASVGVNGLNGFTLDWHEFAEEEERISPMPLEDAIQMANSTRSAPAVLLYAELVYSNWITENAEYNLSWRLVTDRGNYIVDCVLNRHKCDSYEY